jgi:hypothetical protein
MCKIVVVIVVVVRIHALSVKLFRRALKTAVYSYFVGNVVVWALSCRFGDF